MAMSDHLRMHGEGEEPAWNIAVHKGEFTQPNFLYFRRRGEAIGPAHRGAHEFEMWVVVENPRDRQLDEVDGRSKLICPVERDLIAGAATLRFSVAFLRDFGD